MYYEVRKSCYFEWKITERIHNQWLSIAYTEKLVKNQPWLVVYAESILLTLIPYLLHGGDHKRKPSLLISKDENLTSER